MNKNKIISIVFFIILTILTVGLRLLYINNGLWYDEACSWFTAGQGFPFGIIENLKTLDLQHTPLYFFVLHFWMKLFGETEVAMRCLSLIFGIASIPLVYTAAKKLTTRQNALIACALAAVSPVMVIFSVEVRMYPVVVFLVLLSLNYLIDFEQKNDIKSLVKLVVVNLLIPYTLVGGILYNLALWICYSLYLLNNKKENCSTYIKALGIELVCLIPYFMLVSYYAKMRSIFVVAHEGNLLFSHVLEVIKNFFAIQISDNIYWPSNEPVRITFLFALLAIIPCVYMIYGLVQGRKLAENNFIKTLYNIFFLSFGLSVLFSAFQINVFTVRYILYLLPPFLILAVIGLYRKLSFKHCSIYFAIVIILAAGFDFRHHFMFANLKNMAMKNVRIEADKLQLGVDDMVIMPFGSDAPYYFRDLTSPRVFEFDFHKGVRNPYSDIYYDKEQQDNMAGSKKDLTIYWAVKSDEIFSKNYLNYFIQNVNATVPSGRFVLLAMYGNDANSITSIEELRKSIKDEYDVEKRELEIMFKKYLCDMSVLLNADFNFIKSYREGNYKFFIYQKR